MVTLTEGGGVSDPDGGSESLRVVPMLPLRDIVVFPQMVAPLFVGRARSIRALEEAMEGDRELMLSAQREAAQDRRAADAEELLPLDAFASGLGGCDLLCGGQRLDLLFGG